MPAVPQALRRVRGGRDAAGGAPQRPVHHRRVRDEQLLQVPGVGAPAADQDGHHHHGSQAGLGRRQHAPAQVRGASEVQIPDR